MKYLPNFYSSYYNGISFKVILHIFLYFKFFFFFFFAFEANTKIIGGMGAGGIMEYHLKSYFFFFFTLNFFFFFFCPFKAASAAYGGSQARGQIGTAAAGLHHSHSNTRYQATSVTYTTAHHNTGCLTH